MTTLSADVRFTPTPPTRVVASNNEMSCKENKRQKETDRDR